MAEEQFADVGYDGARVDAIAEGAGLSKSNLYFHFPSKAALLSALVELRTAELLETKDVVLSREESEVLSERAPTEAELTRILTRLFEDVLAPRERFVRVLLLEMLKGSEAVTPTLAALESMIADTMHRFERATGHPSDDRRTRALWLYFALVPAMFAIAVPQPLVEGIRPASLAPELARLEAGLLGRSIPGDGTGEGS